MDALVESEPQYGPPYILVGWHGAEALVVNYTRRRPENVFAVVLLDGVAPDAEWRLRAQARGDSAGKEGWKWRWICTSVAPLVE